MSKLKQLHHSFIPQILSAILALATYRFYTEMLIPEELGKAMLILGLIALVDTLVSSSINQSIFYFGSINKYKFFLINFLKKRINYPFFIGFISIVVTILLSLFFNDSIMSHYLILFLIFITYLLIEPFKVSLFSFLNIEASRKIFGIQVCLDSLFNFLSIILFLYINASWFNLLIGVLSARYLSLLSNYIILKKVLSKTQINNFLINESLNSKVFFKYMFPISLMGFLGWLTGFADRFIVASSIGLVDSGVYSLATGVAGRPYNVLSAALTAHFRPDLYRNSDDTLNLKFNKTFYIWFFCSLILGSCGVVLFAFYGHFLVDLLISEIYREEISSLLYLLAFAYTFNIVSHSIENKFLAKNRAKLLLKIQIFIVMLPIIFIFIGGSFYGLIGAVLGKTIAEFLKTAILYFIIKTRKI
jgi:O-antigen/teichoic acid export membrane protein